MNPSVTATAACLERPETMPRSRWGARLEHRLRAAPGHLGLVPYLMAGHPDPLASRDAARRLADLGVAALELGVPCPDPRWDGPVISAAGRRALAAGATVKSTLELAAEIALATDVPIVLMSYLGPVLAHGPRRFAEDAAAAGVAGVIIPDLAVDERGPIAGCLGAAGLDSACVVAPTASDADVALACRASTGFVYCALAGATGARPTLPAALPHLLGRVRRRTSLPLVAGFGISRPEHLEGVKGHADAAVVGSALVAELDAGHDVVPLAKGLLAACR